MKEIDPKEIPGNVIKLIGSDWMLVTAGDKENFNTMTASWGMVGEMWSEPMAITVVRPQRFTREFIDRTGRFTLSFYRPEMKKALAVMGSKSGRDIDKMHYPGLTAHELPSGQMTFDEAWLTLECEVVYADRFTADSFHDKSILDKWYERDADGAYDLHIRYFGRIAHAWVKD